jgi:hypothetical protein
MEVVGWWRVEFAVVCRGSKAVMELEVELQREQAKTLAAKDKQTIKQQNKNTTNKIKKIIIIEIYNKYTK